MTDSTDKPEYWRGVYCTDCGTELSVLNGARRPLAEGFFQLVCVDCLVGLAVKKEER